MRRPCERCGCETVNESAIKLASGGAIHTDVQRCIDNLKSRDVVNVLRRWQIPWSKETFGWGKRTEGLLRHIELEIAEVRQNPDDPEEWIDIVMLALDGAWRTGYTAEEVIYILLKKMAIVRGRKYKTPLSQDEVSEHVD